MSKIGSYEIELINLSPRKWNAFLREHSNLPGPRANIELAKAFAHIGTLMDFKKMIRLGPDEAAENTPEEFLAYCGVLGYGQYLAKHHDTGLLNQLRERANDPRWRIREAVAMALQSVGKKNMLRLLKYTKLWADGSYLEQRAAIVGLCEPELLQTRKVCISVLDLLDWITATIVENDDEHVDRGFQVLEQGLSYCWSVAVAAFPEKGKPMMERWMKENHPIIRKIMRENLKKKRLSTLDPEWVAYWLRRVSR